MCVGPVVVAGKAAPMQGRVRVGPSPHGPFIGSCQGGRAISEGKNAARCTLSVWVYIIVPARAAHVWRDQKVEGHCFFLVGWTR